MMHIILLLHVNSQFLAPDFAQILFRPQGPEKRIKVQSTGKKYNMYIYIYNTKCIDEVYIIVKKYSTDFEDYRKTRFFTYLDNTLNQFF